jgi:signal transduction histidine kinase
MEPEGTRSVRILLVEDEGLTALDTREQLESLGYTVVGSAFSGSDAVALAAELRPDLVLMDIRLRGGSDGVESAKEIRSRFVVPIIFATAYADDKTVQRAKVAEPFGYILKPFDSRELRTVIEVALYEHRMQRQRADFVAMLSHDIRSPLGVILSYAELLGEEIRRGDAKEAEELLHRLTSATLSVHTLVSNYLEASRIESGHMSVQCEPVALNEVLERVCAQYEGEARRRRIVLERSFPQPSPRALADPVATERIVTNLLYNALKFTPAEGRVRVAASAPSRGEVLVSIADTGSGIAPEEVPRLFERYQTGGAGGPGAGTGLGLFIVRTLVEAHGGRVEVGPSAGGGTCFSVHLPAA